MVLLLAPEICKIKSIGKNDEFFLFCKDVLKTLKKFGWLRKLFYKILMAKTKYSRNYAVILFKLNHWLDVVEQKGIPC